jgi:large subunit GTPase 1
MPKNQGTSRKGKPGKNERASGLGKALQRATVQRYKPRSDGKAANADGGMDMQPGVSSIGAEVVTTEKKTKSVLEMQDLDDFLLQADLANREFTSQKGGLVVVDPTTYAYKPRTVQFEDLDEHKETFVFSELSVPRRPDWTKETTPAELDQLERDSFLNWRRGIAKKEEELMRLQSLSSATPFEKNLEVWRQLWRVLERSACLVQLVDARNPLFYLSSDLRDYAAALGKPMMVLVNKSDFLSRKQRQYWSDHLVKQGWNVLFFSAIHEQQKLDLESYLERHEEELDPRKEVQENTPEDDDDEEEDDSDDEEEEDEGPENDKPKDLEVPSQEEQPQVVQERSADGLGIDLPLTRDELLGAMRTFAEKNNCLPDERYENRIQFGMVGFPNVGKSSVINVLVGSSKHQHGVGRVAVASQPGKTKHFQTLFLPDSDDLLLCDCPGLVFPSFVSNTADLIAAGVYPISQMRDHWPVVNLICQRIPREIMNAHYGIHVPTPTALDLRERGLTQLPPPTAEEFLTALCLARSMLSTSSGVPDFMRAARVVIKDYAAGKLLYCHAPPTVSDTSGFQRETIATALLNTKKLREKLLKRQAAENPQLLVEGKLKDTVRDATDLEDLIDLDLLEMVGGSISELQIKVVKKDKIGHRWGKKDRKNRNKDPYGCHSTPDEQFRETLEGGGTGVGGPGIHVKAGKYGRGGYTRANHAGAKGAVQLGKK